jgi:hypothetical protein
MGINQHPLYGIWQAMKRRCYNQNVDGYRWYGAVGISVCKRWRNNFSAFVKDMGPRPHAATLERINTRGNYKPSNCRWATPKEQARNTKANRNLRFKGKLQSVAAWAEELNMPAARIFARIDKLGMSTKKALSTTGKLRGDGSGIEQKTYTYSGITMTLGEWSVLANIRYGTLWARLKRGWTFGDSIGTDFKSGLARQVRDQRGTR